MKNVIVPSVERSIFNGLYSRFNISIDCVVIRNSSSSKSLKNLFRPISHRMRRRYSVDSWEREREGEGETGRKSAGFLEPAFDLSP